MNDNKKIVDKKIRELLTICTNNIKGYTKKEIIEQFLPVQVKNVEIYQEGAKIVVKKEKEEIADIWLDCGNYSNLALHHFMELNVKIIIF